MAPLNIEVYHPENKRWVRVGTINPNDPPVSLSDNKQDCSRDVYMFECSPNDSTSTIYRSRAGVDIEVEQARLLTTAGAEVVKELRRGDDPYEMRIKTDGSQETRLIRFTHM